MAAINPTTPPLAPDITAPISRPPVDLPTMPALSPPTPTLFVLPKPPIERTATATPPMAKLFHPVPPTTGSVAMPCDCLEEVTPPQHEEAAMPTPLKFPNPHTAQKNSQALLLTAYNLPLSYDNPTVFIAHHAMIAAIDELKDLYPTPALLTVINHVLIAITCEATVDTQCTRLKQVTEILNLRKKIIQQFVDDVLLADDVPRALTNEDALIAIFSFTDQTPLDIQKALLEILDTTSTLDQAVSTICQPDTVPILYDLRTLHGKSPTPMTSLEFFGWTSVIRLLRTISRSPNAAILSACFDWGLGPIPPLTEPNTPLNMVFQRLLQFSMPPTQQEQAETSALLCCLSDPCSLGITSIGGLKQKIENIIKYFSDPFRAARITSALNADDSIAQDAVTRFATSIRQQPSKTDALIFDLFQPAPMRNRASITLLVTSTKDTSLKKAYFAGLLNSRFFTPQHYETLGRLETLFGPAAIVGLLANARLTDIFGLTGPYDDCVRGVLEAAKTVFAVIDQAVQSHNTGLMTYCYKLLEGHFSTAETRSVASGHREQFIVPNFVTGNQTEIGHYKEFMMVADLIAKWPVDFATASNLELDADLYLAQALVEAKTSGRPDLGNPKLFRQICKYSNRILSNQSPQALTGATQQTEIRYYIGLSGTAHNIADISSLMLRSEVAALIRQIQNNRLQKREGGPWFTLSHGSLDMAETEWVLKHTRIYLRNYIAPLQNIPLPTPPATTDTTGETYITLWDMAQAHGLAIANPVTESVQEQQATG